MRPRQFVPPSFVAAVLLALAAAPFSAAGRIAGAAVFLSYVAALAWGTLRSAPGQPPAVVARLPVAFLILHLSYGIGFLGGLVRFAGRWRSGAPPPVPFPVGGERP
jgi:hypothetical protein